MRRFSPPTAAWPPGNGAPPAIEGTRTAVLIQMRSKIAKAFIFVLFALLILSFAVWGIGDIFQGPGRNTAVAQVEDVEIKAMDFQTDFNRELQVLQSRVGTRIDFQQARALGLVDQVLVRMINRALYDQRATDLGMTVSDDRVRAQIFSEPAFQNALGEFDRDRYLNTLRATDMSEAEYVRSLRGDLSRQQIASAITAVAAAPDVMAEAIYAYASEKRIAEYFEIARDDLPAAGDPEEAAVQSHYEDNEATYRRPETRAVSLLHLKPEDLAAEIDIGETELRAAFEERREELSKPEQRTVEQLVFSDEETAKAVKAKVEGGLSFADAAAEQGDVDVIPLGTVARRDLESQLPELAAAAFEVAKGAVGGPVRSDFGWHLVNVPVVIDGEEATLEAVRETLSRDLATEQAVDSMIALANQLDDEIAGGATLDQAAQTLGVALLRVPALDARGLDADGQAVGGLPDLKDFLAVLGGLDIGRESLLTETREGGYFMVRIDSVTPASTRPLDEVRDRVVEDWRAAERERMTRERADALAAEAKEGKALNALAEREGLALETTEPVTRTGVSESFDVPRALASQLFEIKPGEVTVAESGNGFVVAKLTGVRAIDAAAEADGIGEVRERLGESIQGDLLAQFSGALRQTYDITVNQRTIDDLLSSAY